MTKKEQLFNAAVGKYKTAKKHAEDLTRFARGLSKEQVVNRGAEFFFVRYRSFLTADLSNEARDFFEHKNATKKREFTMQCHF